MMKFDDRKFLAEQIRLHRKTAGLTQAELAEKVDLSVQHISRIESGCYIPSLKSFFLMAHVLKIDLRIFGYDIKSTSNEQKDKLINKIISASDTEIVFYENLIGAVNKSLIKTKKRLP